MTVYLTEEINLGPGETYTQVWECEPPGSTPYRVLDQQWTDDYNVRIIRKIEIVT